MLDHTKKVFSYTVFSFLLIILIAITAFPSAPSVQAAGPISGVVFRDFNANGIREANEIGVPGITVTAYDDAGVVQGSTTTIGDGTYTFNATGPGPYRVEFSGWLDTDYPGAQGAGSGSSVQFVPNAGAANVNFGINYPAHYNRGDPRYVGPHASNGSPTHATNATRPGLYSVLYSDKTASPTYPGSMIVASTQDQVGTLWSLTHNRFTGSLYGSALVRRHAGLGPGGPGAIYEFANFNPGATGNTVSLLYNFPAASVGTVANEATRFPGAGTMANQHGACFECYNIDPSTFAQVAKAGIGDMDLSSDGRYLYVVTLADRALHRLDLTDSPPTASIVAGAPWLSNAGCNGVRRPWATTQYRDDIYVGTVCDATTALLSNACNFTTPCAALTAQVYIYNPDSNTWSIAFASDIPLTYNRDSYNTAPGTSAHWHPWLDDWPVMEPFVYGVDDVDFGQPILSDISFDVDGSMLLGFLNRTSFQLGYIAATPDSIPGSPLIEEFIFSGGDVLRAGRAGFTGPFTLENNGSVPSPSGTLNTSNLTTSGPGGREFYNDRWAFSSADLTAGALLVLPGTNQLGSLTIDAFCVAGMGVRFMDMRTGVDLGVGRQYYQGNTLSCNSLNVVPGISKASSMGDLELLLDPAPIEIGNRVWFDDNGNGRQDPSEDELANVVVTLHDSTGTQIASATTNADGNYLFSSAAGTSTASFIYGLNLTPNTDYSIRIDTSQAALTGYTPTLANFNGATGDHHDSDGDTSLYAGFSSVNLTTGLAGHNNHTYDFGFDDEPLFSLGNRVWYDTNNNGLIDVTEVGIDGVSVSLFLDQDSNGDPDTPATPVATTTTADGGYYRFDNLAADTYVVRINPGNFTGVGILSGYTSSNTTEADPNLNIDNNDNGLNNTAPATNGILSGSVILGPNPDEPTGETDLHSSGQGAPDNQANMTVDFGFYRLAIGNQLWIDTDNDAQFGGTESGALLSGVRVELYDGATLIAATTTDPNGAYLFDRQTDTSGVATGLGLAPSTNYRVHIPASEFAAGQPLAGFYSSDGNISGTDSRDNGMDVPDLATTGISSAVFSLEPGSATGGAVVTNATASTYNPTLDFGFYNLSLGNLVWLDANNNGLVDGGETGISGITVNLYRASAPATVIATTTTNGTGHYLFRGLNEDDYIVEIVPPAGYLSSTGASVNPASPYEPAPDPDADATDDDDNGTTNGAVIRSEPVSLSAGNEPTGEPATPGLPDLTGDASSNLTVDFGLFVPLRLGNLVWNDTNNNGLVDGGETGIAGVSLELLNSTNTVIATTTTDANGNYLFDNLGAGDYVVRIPASEFAAGEPLEGLRSSTGTNGSATGFYEGTLDPDNNTDNDDNGITQGSGDVQSLPITLSIAGEPATGVDGDDTNGNLTLDFGFFEPASLGDYVWYDTNTNGQQELGETGVPNVTATLYNAADNSVVGTSVTTDANGAYLFENLIPGDYYVIFSNLPAGYAFVAPNLGGDDTLDSDANALTGQTGNYTLVPGQHEPSVDAGIAQSNTLRLGNLVWADYNDNGLVDPGEPGLPGVTVELYDNAMALLDSTVTDTNGNYMFVNLDPGLYIVRIPASEFAVGGPLENWSSSDAAGSYEPAAGPDNDLDNDDNGTTQGSGDVDSLAVTLTLLSEPDTAVDGDDTNGNLTVDFGFVPQLASLGDTVWYDTNLNNVQDPGELGVENVTVRLLDSTGTEIATTTTDTNGNYLFDNLLPGVYSVVFDISSLPANYRFVSQDIGADDSVDSDADPLTGAAIQTTLTAGENDLTWDAGVYQLASIGDTVWYDRNGDGVQDAGEPGMPNVTVHLLDSTGVIITSTTTDANGNYLFSDLEPGDYAIEVVPPSGYSFTTQDSPTGNDTNDSDTDPVTGRTIVTTLDPGEDDLSWDAGLVGILSLGNFIWLDQNNNGEFDPGEPGVANVTVNLLDSTDTVIATTTTDANGNYLFANLIPGDYVVEIVPPAGYTGSTGTNASLTGPYEPAPDPNTNVNNADTGSLSGTRIRSGTISLVAGAGPINDGDTDANTNLTIDFGLFQPASLGNFVWHDQNRNGIQDPGEPGVTNIIVTLYDSSNNPIATTTTSTLGAYNFTNLIPGSYSVGFSALPSTLPEFTSQNMGSDPALDSNADPATGLTAPVSLVAGENNPTIDAGLVNSNPTAVSLQSFTATASEHGSVIRWQTAAEWNSRGFYIYRGTTHQLANAEQITSNLIVARGTGTIYEWTDTNAEVGVQYFYWLAELDTSGELSMHGPALTELTPAAGANRLFIPVVMR